ncbi:hypothetical protein [Flavobacterium sp.]|uniref:hypothetical protein n=1 Tax=Flavobacterium sp. TaxID=239 RepID=UPI0025BD0563|nr:hypothetical protein [Flavobacterium sp.]
MKSKLSSLFILSITFIVFTVVGTISHEYGHIIVAKYLGYETELHYGSMNYEDTSSELKLADSLVKKNEKAILNKKDFPDKEKLDKLWNTISFKHLMITIGGPVQTILTGTIGFILLLFRRKKILENGMKILDWLYVFLSLFWLREVFNLTMSVASALLNGKKNYFGGDERKIAIMLEIPQGSIAIPLALIGLLIALFVIFRIIPKEQRLTFISSGFLGGIAGFILWMRILGPIVMP